MRFVHLCCVLCDDDDDDDHRGSSAKTIQGTVFDDEQLLLRSRRVYPSGADS